MDHDIHTDDQESVDPTAETLSTDPGYVVLSTMTSIRNTVVFTYNDKIKQDEALKELKCIDGETSANWNDHDVLLRELFPGTTFFIDHSSAPVMTDDLLSVFVTV